MCKICFKNSISRKTRISPSTAMNFSIEMDLKEGASAETSHLYVPSADIEVFLRYTVPLEDRLICNKKHPMVNFKNS